MKQNSDKSNCIEFFHNNFQHFSVATYKIQNNIYGHFFSLFLGVRQCGQESCGVIHVALCTGTSQSNMMFFNIMC